MSHSHSYSLSESSSHSAQHSSSSDLKADDTTSLPDSNILKIVERDIRILVSDRYLLVIMFVNFSIDLVISGLSLAALVRGFNYFLFIAPGANLVTAMVAAFQSGRDVWRERLIVNIEPYLLTLPVTRRRFVFSRLLSGMTRTTLTVLPGTIVIAALYQLSIPLFFIGALIIWIYSAAVVGLSVLAANLAKTLEVYTTVRSTVQVYLSFFSTQFYPPSLLANYAFLQVITSLNPMTWAVNSFRELGPLGQGTVDLTQIGYLTLLSLLLLFFGGLSYLRSMPK